MIVRRLTQAFLLLVVLDGALRKWLLPAYSEPLYVLKDVVLSLAVIGLCASRPIRLPSRLRRTMLPLALTLYGAWAFLEGLNPHLPTYKIALLGLRSHLLYLFLLVLTPMVVPYDDVRIRRFVVRYVRWLAVPVLVLAVVQYFAPQDSVLNRYAAEVSTADISTAGLAGRVRVTGTFSYISGMSTFILFNIAIGMGLCAAALRFGGKYMGIGVFLLAVTLTTAPMTGSRSTLYFPAMALPIVLYHVTSASALRQRVLPVALLCSLALYGLSQTTLGEGWTSFGERQAQAGDSRNRVAEAFSGPIWRSLQGGALGFGSGSTHQAAPKLAPNLQPYVWLPTSDFEEENGRIGLELGIPGLALFLLIKLSLVGLAIQLLARAVGPADVLVGSASVVFMLAHIVQAVVFNPVAAALYWALAGVLMERWSRLSTTADSQTRQPGGTSISAAA